MQLMSKPQKVQRERNTTDTARAERPERIPLHKQASVLAVAEVPDGKVGRWVNDVNNGSRLHAFLLAGWEFVTADGITSVEYEDGGVVSRNVGNGVASYLMVLDKELYDEDQKAKADKLLETDRAMQAKTEQDRFYGKVETKITQKKGKGNELSD